MRLALLPDCASVARIRVSRLILFPRLETQLQQSGSQCDFSSRYTLHQRQHRRDRNANGDDHQLVALMCIGVVGI